MKIRFFFLTLFFSFCFLGNAQTDTFQDEIINYLKMNGTNDQYSIAYEGMYGVIQKQFAGAEVPESVWTELKADKDKDINEVLTLLSSAYRKHFTEEDINGMVEFYSSEAGQELLQGNKKPSPENVVIVDEFFRSELGIKINAKKSELATDVSQISEYWSKDLFIGTMTALVKKGYKTGPKTDNTPK